MAGKDVNVVAGAAAKGGRTKPCAPYRWTGLMKARFLDHLAATCNVSASARAIGVRGFDVHRLRRRDAAFASDWGTAIEAGYQLLETHLVGIALVNSGAVVVVDDGVGVGGSEGVSEGVSGGGAENGSGAAAVAAGVAVTPKAADLDAAFSLLRHRATERARGPRGGRPLPGGSTRADTDAEILKKLAALAARRSST